MALDGSYGGLLSSIADWLNRTDLVAVIPDFVSLAESQMSRRLLKDGPVRRMMGRADATIISEFTSLPADYMGTRGFKITGCLQRSLQFAEPEQIDNLKEQYVSPSGDPTHYAIVGDEYQLWPWAGTGSYAAEIKYWKRLAPLASNSSNWLYAINPDAYLYTALLQAAPYLKDDLRIQTWGTFAEQIMADIIGADKIERHSPNLAMPPANGGFTP